MSAGETIGVDLGGTKMLVGVLDGTETSWESREASTGQSEDELVELLVREVCEARDARPGARAVGLGIPATIDHARGIAVSAVNLPLENLAIRDLVEERVGLPVFVDNDANLAALAELHWGAGRDASNLVYLTAGTGIGSGIVIDGRLYRGAGGTAGEIGHTTIDEGGPICRCGSRGCLETFAAMPAILELLKPSLGADLTAERVIEQAADGDLACQRAIGDAGRHLGAALANLCNLVNPERIVVGGSLAQAGATLLDPMRETVQRRAIVSAAKDVEVVEGELSERAEMLGAVALVLYEVETTTNF
jgi:glucokinase-like ROK family protein